MNKKNCKIGVFDSGLGGVTVLKSLLKDLPYEEYIYYGDSGNAPYGSGKTKEEIQNLCAKIMDFLVENTRTPFTEIAKQMNVSAGTIHVRVKKMEDAGIIQGSSLVIDYSKLEFNFTAYIGILLSASNKTQNVLKELATIPNVVEISVTSGKYNIFCKIIAKNTEDAKRIIYQIDDINDVMRTESMISMEEHLSDTNRLIKAVSV